MATVAMEAGYCWQPLYDRLEETGYDVMLAHPLKVKAIAQAKVKTDKIDSETLAHLLRADLLPESYVPPRDIRELRTGYAGGRFWWGCVQCSRTGFKRSSPSGE